MNESSPRIYIQRGAGPGPLDNEMGDYHTSPPQKECHHAYTTSGLGTSPDVRGLPRMASLSVVRRVLQIGHCGRWAGLHIIKLQQYRTKARSVMNGRGTRFEPGH